MPLSNSLWAPQSVQCSTPAKCYFPSVNVYSLLPSTVEMRGLYMPTLMRKGLLMCFSVFSMLSTSCPSLCLVTGVPLKWSLFYYLGNRTLVVSNFGLLQIYLDLSPPYAPEVLIANKKPDACFSASHNHPSSNSLSCSISQESFWFLERSNFPYKVLCISIIYILPAKGFIRIKFILHFFT